MKRRKVFTVYGQGSDTVRKALIRRGWVEKDPISPKCMCKLSKKVEQSLLSGFIGEYKANFIWGKQWPQKKNPSKTVEVNTTCHIYKGPKRRERPIRNRLIAINHWSTKYGIYTSLKSSFWYYIDNVAEVITPRTFSNIDNYEKIEFIHDYQLTACTSLLRWIIDSIHNNKVIFNESGGISIEVMVFAILRCREYFYTKVHKDIDSEICKVVPEEQWNYFLKKYRSLIDGTDVFHNARNRNVLYLIKCAKYLLGKILRYRPQLRCEGCYNIWIIKPSGYSRGRGIEMSSKLDHIMDIITKTNKLYVIQKYIGEKNFLNLF